MPDSAEKIRLAASKAFDRWFNYIELQDGKILAGLRETADALTERINRLAVAGELPNSALIKLRDYLQEQTVLLRKKMTGIITRGRIQGISNGLMASIESMNAAMLPGRYKINIGTSFIGPDSKIRRYDATQELFAASQWSVIQNRALSKLLATPSARVLSDRIWDVTYQAQKTIQSRIVTAIASGQSPAELSRDIRGFLVEPNRLFRRVNVNGRLVLSRPAAAYHPGVGVYRSSYKNAMRLARTEMAQAYMQGTIAYANEKEWIDGWIWRTSGIDPCEDCLALEGKFFAKDDEPDLLHPNDMCYLELHIAESVAVAA
jgi:hypothetical protein